MCAPSADQGAEEEAACAGYNASPSKRGASEGEEGALSPCYDALASRSPPRDGSGLTGLASLGLANRALHPELRARLSQLGIGISSGLLTGDEAGGGGSSGSNSAPRLGKQESSSPTSTLSKGSEQRGGITSSGSPLRRSPQPAEGLTRRHLLASDKEDCCIDNGKENEDPEASAPSRGLIKGVKGIVELEVSKVQEAVSPPRTPAKLTSSAVDDLLLQLDDLDARSASLTRKDSEATLPPKPRSKKNSSAAARGDGDTEAQGAAMAQDLGGYEGTASAGSSTSKARREEAREQRLQKQQQVAHPLEGMSLNTGASAGAAESDFQQRRGPGQRNRRQLAQVSSPAGISKGDASLGRGAASSLAASVLASDPLLRNASATGITKPSSAKTNVREGSGLSLPSLKPSASAPSCLMRGPWAGNARGF